MNKIDSLILLKLLGLPKIGTKTGLLIANYLIANNIKIANDRELYDVVSTFTKRKPFSSANEISAWSESTDKIIEGSELKGIKMISIFENNYPQNLKNTNNPPLLLYYLGDLNTLNEQPNIAIIGTRTPTEYGVKAGKRLGTIFAENNVNVVSGLAIGCDTAGHEGAVKVNRPTTAVLAHGLDSVYPAANRGLAKQILANGGLLISEYSFGTKSFRNHFVERDRIQAGLSSGTIVIETGLKGGTLHTVQFTRDYKRKLYCLAHPEKFHSYEQVQGNLRFLDEKIAKPIDSPESIEQLISDIALDNVVEAPEQLSFWGDN